MKNSDARATNRHNLMVAVRMNAASVYSSMSVTEETNVTEPVSSAAIVLSPSRPSGLLSPCLGASVVHSSSKERATL